jgi:hypothetical protein
MDAKTVEILVNGAKDLLLIWILWQALKGLLGYLFRED